MNKQEICQYLISPEKYYPKDLRVSTENSNTNGNLLDNEKLVNALSNHTYALQKFHFWSTEEIEKMQEARFDKLLNYLNKNSKFWKNYIHGRGVRERGEGLKNVLRRFPVIDKRTLANWSRPGVERLIKSGYYVLPDKNVQLITRRSGGTTGLPVSIKRDVLTQVTLYPFRFQHPIFSQELLKNIWGRKFIYVLGGGGINHNLSDFVYASHSITSTDLEDSSVRNKIYNEIKSIKQPMLLFGYASLILRFAEYLESDAVKFSTFFAVKIGAEHIFPEERSHIKDILGIPVLNSPSCTEVGSFGFECPENLNRFHIDASKVFLEIVDENNLPTSHGTEGQIVLTALYPSASIFIRYNIGDLGKILLTKCPCGRNTPTFEYLGRKNEQILLPSGKKVKVIFLYRNLMRAGITRKLRQFQIQQTASNHLKVLIVPGKSFNADIESSIRPTITSTLNNEKMLIDIETVEEIPTTSGGKPQSFIPLEKSITH